MKRLLLAAGLLCLASAAQAQMGVGANPDLNGDGKVTATEFKTAQADAMLKRLDANRDGKISKAEMQSVGGGERQGMMAMMFQRRDTDNDGFISRAEIEAGAQRRFDNADTNKDGWLSTDEIASMRQNRGREAN